MTLNNEINKGLAIGFILLACVVFGLTLLVRVLANERDDWTARKDATVKACFDLGYTRIIIEQHRISCTKDH